MFINTLFFNFFMKKSYFVWGIIISIISLVSLFNFFRLFRFFGFSKYLFFNITNFFIGGSALIAFVMFLLGVVFIILSLRKKPINRWIKSSLILQVILIILALTFFAYELFLAPNVRLGLGTAFLYFFTYLITSIFWIFFIASIVFFIIGFRKYLREE